MKRLLFSILVLFSVFTSDAIAVGPAKRQSMLQANQIYAGARLGIGIPTALGREASEVSFRDVASIGFAAHADCMWMASSILAVGGELSFNTFPYKEQFWASLGQRGSFDASYLDLGAGLTGRIFIGSYDLKPFLGMAVNAHYLNNKLNFDSKFAGSSQDESVAYTSTQIKPGFAFEIGFLYKVGDKSHLSLAMRTNILPFLQQENMKIVDSYSYAEKLVVVNPHGNQNNIEAILGLHFATKTSKVRNKH